MAVVVYTCDTCKRSIEIPQNKQGLEVVGRCIVTSNCKGMLKQQSIKSSYVRGKLPAPDPTGLVDWSPRRVFYNHNQTIAAKKWIIHHNLGTNPSIQAFIYTVDGVLTEVVPVTTIFVDPYNVTVEFQDAVTGTVQCIARSTVTQAQLVTKYVPASLSNPILLTGGSVLTIATLSSEPTIVLHAQFISPVFATPTQLLRFTFASEASFLSPWKNTHKLFINGRLYTVRTAVVNGDITSAMIDSASPFYFSQVTTGGVTISVGGSNNNRVKQGDILVLTSYDPHESTDKNTSQVFDIVDIDINNTITSSYQIEGELYINSSILRSVYPAIKIVD
jgi:hypothetical protein